ncbi:MAG: UvrD-helicase domain-containing protein [Bryobacterales bacterium]
MSFLETLNPRQKEAVVHTDGPLLILAGAGSGKTRVIISRIAYLVQNKNVAPHSILAVTFTNKAAEEMRSRVESTLAESGTAPSSSPVVSTFHSFCVRLLRRRGAPLAEQRPGFTQSFSIYDDKDQLQVIKSVYKQLGLDEKFLKARSALSVVSQAKNQGRTPEDFYKTAASPKEERLAMVFERYQDALRSANALDFDDLLLEGVRLLRHNEKVREWANQRFHYVMVDEYQDTNRAQYDLMRLLTDHNRNICVVGDEDQSIYSWRGADIRNILDFEKDYPDAAVIRLDQNYRSTQIILKAAGAVVAQNVNRKGKDLWSEGEEGSPILFHIAQNGEEEAFFVAGHIHRYLDEDASNQAAILYRTNSQSRQVEEALRRYGRDYVVVGGVSFYARAEVKDVLAYLRAALTPTDSVSLFRIINNPARGIGRTTTDSIEEYAAEHRISPWEAIARLLDEKAFGTRAHSALAVFRKLIINIASKISQLSVHEAIVWTLEETGYRRMLDQDPSVEAQGRLENLDELINAAADAATKGESLHEFLDRAALVADTDQISERARLLLMTLHSAKGLEFPLVAIIGMEEGIFPHSRAFEDPDALEEERRLCYVGMTRARRRLLLTCARSRRRYGGSLPEAMAPSRFLREVPQDFLAGPDTFSSGGSETWHDDGFDQDINWNEPGIDLYSERKTVRQIAEGRLLEAAGKSGEGNSRKSYGGETYDSVDNLAKFFSKRGLPFDPAGEPGARPGAKAAPPSSPQGRGGQGAGATGAAAQRATASASPQPAPRRPQQQTFLGMGPEPAASPQRPPNAGYSAPATGYSKPTASYPPRAKPAAPPRFATRPITRGPFRPGTKVRHAKFGVGTVMRLEGEGENQKLSINFAGYGLKKVVLKYAGLQRA